MEANESYSCPIHHAGPPPWDYQCLACGHVFEMPAPSGPSEEKDRTCPRCQSHEIWHPLNVCSEISCPGG